MDHVYFRLNLWDIGESETNYNFLVNKNITIFMDIEIHCRSQDNSVSIVMIMFGLNDGVIRVRFPAGLETFL
jgi:hypothetical protein